MEHQTIPSLDFVSILADDLVVLPAETESYTPNKWALILEGLTNAQRLKLWPLIDQSLEGAILYEMRDDARQQLLSVLTSEELEDAVKSSSDNEVVEILTALPQKLVAKLINKLSPQSQSNVESSLSYDEEQVGRYANSDVYTVKHNTSIEDALDEIRQSDLTDYSGNYIVLDDESHYVGEVSINDLLNAEGVTLVQAIAEKSDDNILDTLSLMEASNLIKNSNRPTLPILTDAGKFVGEFSMGDALSIFQHHYEAQVAHMGQVSDEDLFAPIFTSARRRALWLGINLITAFLASAVIGIFDKVLIEVVALAVLMPIVASMGGITGSQTLTLTIRGLATGQLNTANYRALRDKELSVAAVNAVVWAVIVAAMTIFWFDNYLLSVILSVAMVVNMLVAALSGIIIPMVLDKNGIDPALAGSVILTTVTDVVGFFVFLGSATIIFMS
ncbi:magnesium transporter [Psychrosphaera saromensis]|uniref:magnesium transporter n=1 Tax=Psychrosphaera saromensis TaxID=716813 RepID=UPI000CF3AFB2|nr:magnesium transporter [Psychrosphaera saromensis]GHB66283.1 magnesium transporter [Psychrosphaera saromensis]GLQ14888.1 magnesium transporter [Psychrosphaera saromensis]